MFDKTELIWQIGRQIVLLITAPYAESNTNTQIHKYTNTQIQIRHQIVLLIIAPYAESNTNTQIHKYKYAIR